MRTLVVIASSGSFLMVETQDKRLRIVWCSSNHPLGRLADVVPAWGLDLNTAGC